jgi:hypothetical protein
LAKILVDGKYVSAKAYRLASSKPAYVFQHLYHHLTSKREYMTWKGEYQNGNFSDYVTVPASEYDHWKRRIQAGEAKPEAQLMSEWSERAARPADLALYYHNTIKVAQSLKKIDS